MLTTDMVQILPGPVCLCLIQRESSSQNSLQRREQGKGSGVNAAGVVRQLVMLEWL